MLQACLCLLGAIHVIGFASLALQGPLLFGSHGLQPVSAYLQLAAAQQLPAGASYTQCVMLGSGNSRVAEPA